MVLPNKKRQRKPSKNPEINALLEIKYKWENDVSVFIEDIISAKRGLSGAPDSRVGFSKSKITQPVNPKAISLLQQLVGRYRDISNRGLEIAQKQNELATKHRLKPKGHSAPKSDMSNPLEPKTTSAEYILYKDASGRLSRMWYKAKSMFSKDPNRPVKKDLLNHLVETKKSITDIQKVIVNVNPGEQALSALQSEIDSFQKKLEGINLMLASIANKYNLLSDPKISGLIVGNLDPYQTILKNLEVEFNILYLMPRENVRAAMTFHKLKNQYQSAYDRTERKKIIEQIRELYKDTILFFKRKYPDLTEWNTFEELKHLFDQKVNSDHEKSLKEIALKEQARSEPEVKAEEVKAELPKEPVVETETLQTSAGRLSNFIRNKRTQLLPFAGPGETYRIDAYKICNQLRKEINSLMNLIEDESDFINLANTFSEIKMTNSNLLNEVNDYINTVSINTVSKTK